MDLVQLNHKETMTYLLADQPLDQIEGLSGYAPKGNLTSDYLDMGEHIISNILAVLSILGGIYFVVYFLLGGLNWITAGGDQGKIDKAKKQMTGATIGLIIISASYAISYIVGLVTGIHVLEPASLLKDLGGKP